MMKYLQTIWLLLLFLVVSCSGNAIVKDMAGEQGGGVKVEEEEKTQESLPFILGPGDQITVKVWRNDDLTRTMQIDPTGNIQFPLVGELKASGLTTVQLRGKITSQLSKYLFDPKVDINVSNLQSQKVYVFGEVKTPGTIDWRVNMPVWEVIAKAGGFTVDADEKNILLVRSEDGKAVVRAWNMSAMLKGKQSQGTYLRNGDIVYVLPEVIVSVERFMVRFSNIINPLLGIERGIIFYPEAEAVLRGKASDKNIILSP